MRCSQLMIILAMLLSSGIAFSQLNESDTLKYQVRIGVSGIKQTGNVDIGILRSRMELLTQLGKCITFKSQNNTLYQEFGGLKADNDINSRNYLYLLPAHRIYPFAMAYFQTNFRLKIDSRYFFGAGITWQAIQTKHHVLKLSGSMVYENTKFTINEFNTSYYAGKDKILIWRPTIYISGYHKFAHDKIKINYSTYLQSGIDKVPNHRIYSELGLDFMLWKGLSFTVQYLRIFEKVVVKDVLQLDNILTLGLNYQLKSK
jgi:hypothetical protein